MQLMMPVFWASEEGGLTHSLANEFKQKVYGAKYGMEAAVWGGVGLGGGCVYTCVNIVLKPQLLMLAWFIHVCCLVTSLTRQH